MRIKRDKLDDLVSRYIRLRAKNHCERCGRWVEFEKLQACHFHSRRKRATRYDEENIIALDYGCHQYFHENPREFEEFMKERLGEGFDLLLGRARTPAKYIDREALRLYFSHELEVLKEEE